MFNNDYTNYSDKIMKKRKIYEKPAMQVFELKQQPQLLAGSVTGDVNATMSGDWDEETI